MKVILASESPRRIKLLKKIFKSFSVVPSGVDETSLMATEKDPVYFALKAAEAKARAVATIYPDSLVIAADTVVTIDNLILGKPASRAEAQKMLETLSGRTHRVITAVALINLSENKFLTDAEQSLVTFKPLTREEIEAYLNRNTYLDKAGAYAIQEVKELFLEKLEGDYHNVVGLPLRKLRQLLHRFQEKRVILEISGFDLSEAAGLGEVEGQVVKVPGAYLGELVEVCFEPAENRQVKARLLSLIKKSPARQPAPCQHFGTCGGCTFQDLHYNEQLKYKANYLKEVLREYFAPNFRYLEIDPVLPSPSQYYYRNKMEFSFGQSGEEIFLGLKEKSRERPWFQNKKVVKLKNCHISTQITEKLFPLVSELAKKSGLPAFELKTKQGFYRHLVIREGKQTGDLMLILVTSSQAQLPVETFTSTLITAFPELKSFWWVENDRIADVVAFEKSHLLYGQEFIEEKLLDFRFRVYPGSFFQTNPLAAELVYNRIVEEARRLRTQSALGLYCGSGAIEICLSRVAGEVVGVDWDAASLKAANENLVLNRIQNVRFWESSVEAVLPEIYRGAFDLLVIDPPRAGISPKGLRQIVALRIPNIIYVSCNPATLARDLKILVDSGYQINRLTPVDFFPHTAHLEVMAFLSR